MATKARNINPIRPRDHHASFGRNERTASNPQANRKSSVPEPCPNTLVASKVSTNPIDGVATRAARDARRARKGAAA